MEEYGDITLDKRKISAVILIGLLFFGGVLALSAFKKVEQTELALKKNTFTGKVSPEVYGPGRHYIGLFHTFIYFPAIQITIEFKNSEDSTATEITGRTKDGLALALEISFQYQLLPDKVYELYLNFAELYEATFIRIAREEIRDVSSKYTAIEFFNNRTGIGFDMEETLRKALLDVFTDVPGFQLRNVDLPDSFEDAIERSEVARQEIEIARLEQQAALVRAQTAILEAQAQANITLIEANASAQAFIIQMEAQAKALNITLTAQSEAYYALAQALNLTSTELLSFLWIQALLEIGSFGNLIIIGENTPVILNPTPPDNSTSTP
ncbi:MAG: hypothetical protein D6732_02500 [Methanobacteriota archaeon]|nr:MAG: hypothetical protein D6732_02500 [Euryarchaeota archaeon]